MIKHYIKRKDTTGLIPTILHNDELFEDSGDNANMMNEYFTYQTQVSNPTKQIHLLRMIRKQICLLTQTKSFISSLL